MINSIFPTFARVYYNRGNPFEPFCMDFGTGTPSIVCGNIEIHGDWVFKFDEDEDADPCAWFQPLASTNLEVTISTTESKVVIRDFRPAEKPS